MKFPKFFLEIFNPVLSQQRCIQLENLYNAQVYAKYYPDIKVIIEYNLEDDRYIIVHQFYKDINDDDIIASKGYKPCPDQP